MATKKKKPTAKSLHKDWFGKMDVMYKSKEVDKELYGNRANFKG